jgi:predicted GNAT family acetyltransferase
MTPGADPAEVERTLASERSMVRTLGGFVLGIAGADLVTHEKIPIPRFNFVEVGAVSTERRTAFFERSLDHYFQRALRPAFRVPLPVPVHLDRGLQGFGFRPRPEPFSLLIGHGRPVSNRRPGLDVRPAHDGELDAVIELWAEPRARPELRTAVDVAWHHPNPGEQLVPFVATRDASPVAAALVYENAGTVGIHFVTTKVSDRGQGVASTLVVEALTQTARKAGAMGYLFADSTRLEERLNALGLEHARGYRIYELPPEAELALPPPGPPLPPQWRPPRPGSR